MAVGRFLRAVFAVGRGVPGTAVVILLAGAAWATFALVSAHVDHYLLKDEIAEIARAPVRDDAYVRERLRHAVAERHLDPHVDDTCFEVHSGPIWRRIECEYQVPVKVLPGLERKLRFKIHVQEPYLPRDEGR